MNRYFVSYARESRSLVDELVDDLKCLGGTVWFDRQVTGGQLWWNQILFNIRASDVFIFALSAASIESVACRRECTYATQLLRPVVPLLLDGEIEPSDLPSSIAELHVIDYRSNDKSAFKELARSLVNLRVGIPLPTPLPDPPPPPLSYAAVLKEQIDSDNVLTYESQSRIILELRNALRDPLQAHVARSLLRRLRTRRDLLAVIGDEINSLVGESPPPPPPPPVQPVQPDTARGATAPSASLGAGRPAPEVEIKNGGSTVDESVGNCPNCHTQLPLDSLECIKCHALFGPHSAWTILPKQKGSARH